MDNDEKLLIQELYPFNRFLKRCWLPKIVFQMNIWDVPSSLVHLDKYVSQGCFFSCADEGWKGKEAKLGSGSQSCKHA